MNSAWPVLLVAFCLGGLTGLRAFMPLTVLAWMLHLSQGSLPDGPLRFLHETPAVVILTIVAVVEWIADKLPGTPSRLRLPGLVGRAILGAVCGIIAGEAWGASWGAGAIAGLVGAVLGAWVGYEVRTRWARELRWPDLVVALIEDAVAIGGTVLIVSRAMFLSY